MVPLKAENRSLLLGGTTTSTDANYQSGVSSMLVGSVSSINADDYVLIGSFGAEDAEILRVTFTDTATNSVTFGSSTKYAHPESTAVTVIQYNQVNFYWTSTTTFSDSNPLSGWINIDASSWYTEHVDHTKGSGYGWFLFRNSTTGRVSSVSNYIPYTNFARFTVKDIMDDFFSMLRNKERKQVDVADAFSWLNEAYSVISNELNLVNKEYRASGEQTLSIVSGTQEYALPDDFGDLIAIWPSASGITYGTLEALDIGDVSDHDLYGSTPKYYLRGAYIGISPVPTSDATYKYRYAAKTAALTDYTDTVDLPDNMAYSIKDHMMFRAHLKLGNNQEAANYKALFAESVANMKSYSIQRDRSPDSFDIEYTASV